MALWKKAIDKQFQDYELRTTYDKNGNERQKYVYAREYFKPQISHRAFIIRKILFWVLFLAAGASQAYAGTRTVYVNFQTLVTIFQSIGIVGMLITTVPLVYYTCANEKMKKDIHRNCHTRFTVLTAASGFSFAATFLCALVFSLTGSDTQGLLEGLCVGLYAFSAACMLVMWLIEKNTSYEIIGPDIF